MNLIFAAMFVHDLCTILFCIFDEVAKKVYFTGLRQRCEGYSGFPRHSRLKLRHLLIKLVDEGIYDTLVNK